MKTLLKLEHLKYKRTNLFIIFSVAISISYFVPLVLIYTVMGSNLSPLIILSEVLNFNGYLTLPILTILHFSYFLSYEYEKKMIYILKTSIFSLYKIFSAKFFYSIITFIGVFIPANTLLVGALYMSKANNASYINTVLYTWDSILGIYVITHIMYIIYFINLGTITLLINSIGFEQKTTIILSFSIFILLRVLPIPKEISRFTFLEGINVVNNLMDFHNVIFLNIQIVLISIIYIIVFYYLTQYFFSKN